MFAVEGPVSSAVDLCAGAVPTRSSRCICATRPADYAAAGAHALCACTEVCKSACVAGATHMNAHSCMHACMSVVSGRVHGAGLSRAGEDLQREQPQGDILCIVLVALLYFDLSQRWTDAGGRAC